MTDLSATFHLSSEHLSLVRSILKTKLPDVDAYVFGSRAGPNPKKQSDLDIALTATKPIDWRVMADLREALEESDLPIRVDLVDWSTCSDEFKRHVSIRVPL
jgi:uncharacterized protein